MARSTARRVVVAPTNPEQEHTLTQAERLFGPIHQIANEGLQDTLLDLINQRSELDQKIAQLKSEHRKSALIQISNLIQMHNFTAQDLFPSGIRKIHIKQPPKYRNPATGETWSGRGKPPRWVVIAEDRDALLIARQDSDQQAQLEATE